MIAQLRQEFTDSRIDAFQALAGKVHFWCELLAQVAHTLDEIQGRYDQAKKMVIEAMTSVAEHQPPGWTALLGERIVIERAVELVLEHLPRIATGGIGPADAFHLI